MPVPDSLLRISEKAMNHPAVVKTGVTKTEAGEYALLATVRKGTSTPISEIADLAVGFPVVYKEEEGQPVAWPARPRGRD